MNLEAGLGTRYPSMASEASTRSTAAVEQHLTQDLEDEDVSDNELPLSDLIRPDKLEDPGNTDGLPNEGTSLTDKLLGTPRLIPINIAASPSLTQESNLYQNEIFGSSKLPSSTRCPWSSHPSQPRLGLPTPEIAEGSQTQSDPSFASSDQMPPPAQPPRRAPASSQSQSQSQPEKDDSSSLLPASFPPSSLGKGKGKESVARPETLSPRKPIAAPSVNQATAGRSKKKQKSGFRTGSLRASSPISPPPKRSPVVRGPVRYETVRLSEPLEEDWEIRSQEDIAETDFPPLQTQAYLPSQQYSDASL